MIIITIYAYLNAKWVEQTNYTRPFQGADKLDETLDSAIMEYSLQPQTNILAPFTEFKIVANDGATSQTRYFVVGDSECTKERMGD